MTDVKNVKGVVDADLCIGCGLCKAICQLNAIEYKRLKGMYVPHVNAGKCVNCGRCMKICPGLGCDYSTLYKMQGENLPQDLYAGNYIDTFTAVTKDSTLLKYSTSGGVITSLVRHFLNAGTYDCAFLVDAHNYSEAINAVRKTADDDLQSTCKSRYIPVQQTAAVEYMLAHPDERIIFVGVPCFVQGLLRIMNMYGINRDRHFIIGLFCAATMNYNIWDYLTTESDMGTDTPSCLHFRDKSSGNGGKLCSSWPGDVCAIGVSGKKYMKRSYIRTDAKKYFEPERCLYCIDKLNQFADVSVGDNYTGRNNGKLGSSSVIIRTSRGMAAKNEQLFNIIPESMENICLAQKIVTKNDNLCFQHFCNSALLHCNNEIPLPENWEEYRASYDTARAALELGAQKDFAAIKSEIDKKAAEKKKRKSLYRKILRFFGFKI